MRKNSVQFEIIVGTYEEFVLGYQFLLQEGSNDKAKLTQVFATHSHRASVKCVTSRGNLVVSGGTDETINIYNMFTRKECGMLMEHNGTVTSLNFTPDLSHLISTSEDGSIKIFRQGSWQLEKVWPSAHKGTAVTCLAVHPSGKMALSLGKDHTLRTWNLVKGRPAYTTNLYSRCRQLEYVVWSPGGELFAIPMECKLELTSTEKGGVLHTLTLPSKITTCYFLSDEVVCVGEASGDVSGHSTQSGSQLWKLPGEQRIRGLSYLNDYLVTATSSGTISVYFVGGTTSQPRLATSTDTGCRITCLTLYDYKSEVKIKKELKDKKEETHKKHATNNFSTLKKKAEEIVADSEVLESRPANNFSKKQKDIPSSDEAKKPRALNNNHPKKTAQVVCVSEEVKESRISNSSSKKRIQNEIGSDSEEPIESRKSTNLSKKQRVLNSKAVSVEIMCSPKNQKWIVEDSKR